MMMGARPLKAISDAQEIAGRRGAVLDKSAIPRSRYDFVLFIEGCTVFVRDMRIRTHISTRRISRGCSAKRYSSSARSRKLP